MSDAVKVAAIVLGVVLGWVLVSRAVSLMSGWAWLADFYAARLPFTGKQWHAGSLGMRWPLLSYNNCTTIGADAEGFFIKARLLMRAGHPPLFVPWSDVTVEHGKFWIGRFVRLRFKKQPGIPVIMTEKMALRLAEAAGDAWPEARTGESHG